MGASAVTSIHVKLSLDIRSSRHVRFDASMADRSVGSRSARLRTTDGCAHTGASRDSVRTQSNSIIVSPPARGSPIRRSCSDSVCCTTLMPIRNLRKGQTEHRPSWHVFHHAIKNIEIQLVELLRHRLPERRKRGKGIIARSLAKTRICILQSCSH